ncbi:MAG: O-antigen ligase family protein [Planctomycetaceae bacterium]
MQSATLNPTLTTGLNQYGLPQTTVRSREQAEVIRAGLVSLTYFLVANIGYFTAFDAVGVALAMAVLIPAWRPYLLLLVTSVHDAPGQADPSVYAAVCGITLLMLFSAVINPNLRTAARTVEDRAYSKLVLAGLALVTYGLVSSFVQIRLNLHEQLEDRPYYILGGLMAMTIVSGFLANRLLTEDPYSSVRLRTVCGCILGHILFITVMQTVMGPSFGASGAGQITISQHYELFDGGDRGMARLTGPFLSPNTLAMLPCLYMLIYLRASRGSDISDGFIVCFMSVGIALAVLGGARSMFGFYLLSSGVLVFVKSPKRAIGLGLMALPLLFVVGVPWDDLLVLMRFHDVDSLQSLGIRGSYWNACLYNLTREQWLFGSGLSHWPVFLLYYVGYPGADPHNWVFSMAGSFGVFGLLFYVLLGASLFRRGLSGPKRYRAIALCLLILLLGRDLANVQYVINNHAMGALYWVAIASAFMSQSEIGQSDASALTEG